jgi:hypothetical protein
MVGKIKHIIVIESLNALKTGEALYNDVIERRIKYYQPDNDKMTHRFFNPKTKNDFLEVLNYIIFNSDNIQGGLLIHLEMHGSSDLNGLILADDSLILWTELTELFRQINIKMCDKLFITMATCFGRHLYKGGNAKLKSPYSGYISASNEVLVDEVMRDYTILFESLIETRNIVESYLHLDSKGSSFFYKDSLAVFEDSFKSILEKMKADPNIKTNILKIAMEESAKAGEPIADKEMKDLIFNLALENAYKQHKEAYIFNC